MGELDLTEAIEVGRAAASGSNCTCGFESDLPGADCWECCGDAAVRAAAPIIVAAEREAIVARIEAAFVTGAVAPPWAQAGGKPTAAGIRRWVVGIVRGEVGDG